MSPRSKLLFIKATALVAAWLCGSAALAGQSAGPAPVTASGTTPVKVGAPTPLPAGGYDSGGRRDPFLSLIVPKPANPAPRPASTARPGAGLAGIAVSDVQLKGVIRSGANFVAILEGPDGRTFLAKRSDRLMNGVIKGIESGAVVFTERVEDAAGAVRVRDVRKALRAAAVAGGQL
jgi:Tfp pilus assembly protein PilP